VKSHTPVLLEETLEQLNIREDGLYVDGTFGRGGHGEAILSRLGPGGRLLALDRDPEAVKVGNALAERDRRLVIEQGSFGELEGFLERHGATGAVNGVLLDLGVSSPQLDDSNRGFSFQLDGPLDMRMDPAAPESARDWLNAASEKSIVDVLFRYGEETAARKIARVICERRVEQPIETTGDLARLIARVRPRRAGARGSSSKSSSTKGSSIKRSSTRHPATKTFQAIRIHINRELEALELGLPQALDALTPGGRLCAISFHSLEDRIVKRFLRDNARVDPKLARLPVVPESAQPRLRLPTKAIRPGPVELERNPRARSATLRVGERLA
jgi:16S rRNA (cytosine1402-N4)-methyltransferase